MDVKRRFDHVPKGQILIRMIELGFDNDLMTWMSSFLIDWKIQLVINSHDKEKREIETGIP